MYCIQSGLCLAWHAAVLACLVEGDDVVEACPGLARVHVVVAAHLAAWDGELVRESGEQEEYYSICRVNTKYYIYSSWRGD